MITPEPQSSGDVEKLILRFLEGSANSHEVVTLQEWLAENAHNKKYFDELNATYQASVTINRVNTQNTDLAWSELAEKLSKSKAQNNFTANQWFIRVAASLLIVAIAWFAIDNLSTDQLQSQQSSLVKNSPARNTRIVLPDSSIVYLNTNSVLEYPPAFGAKSREVQLKGEAFFEVKKGKQPFIVKTEGISIKVKGTRFNVQAYNSDSDVKATLEEGSIELRVDGDSKVYALIPGEQVILNNDKKHIVRKKVDPSNFTAWKEDELIFDNVTLQEIVNKLENRFRINIVVNQDLARRERLTMTITEESLEEVLEQIRLSSRLKVSREINDIVITDK